MNRLSYYCPSCEHESMSPTNRDGDLYNPQEELRSYCSAPFCYCTGVGIEMIPLPSDELREGVSDEKGDRCYDEGEDDSTSSG